MQLQTAIYMSIITIIMLRHTASEKNISFRIVLEYSGVDLGAIAHIMILHCAAEQTLPHVEPWSEVNVLIINICISELENRKSNLNRNETQCAKRQQLVQHSHLFSPVFFFFVPDEALGAAFPGPNDNDICKHSTIHTFENPPESVFWWFSGRSNQLQTLSIRQISAFWKAECISCEALTDVCWQTMHTNSGAVRMAPAADCSWPAN